MKSIRSYLFITICLLFANNSCAMSQEKTLIETVKEAFPGQNFPPSFEVALDYLDNPETNNAVTIEIPNQFLLYSSIGNGKTDLINLITKKHTLNLLSSSSITDKDTGADEFRKRLFSSLQKQTTITFLVLKNIENLNDNKNALKDMLSFLRENKNKKSLYYSSNKSHRQNRW